MSKQFKKINFNSSFGASADGNTQAKTEGGADNEPPEKVKKSTTPVKAKSPTYNFKKFKFDPKGNVLLLEISNFTKENVSK